MTHIIIRKYFELIKALKNSRNKKTAYNITSSIHAFIVIEKKENLTHFSPLTSLSFHSGQIANRGRFESCPPALVAMDAALQQKANGVTGGGTKERTLTRSRRYLSTITLLHPTCGCNDKITILTMKNPPTNLCNGMVY